MHRMQNMGIFRYRNTDYVIITKNLLVFTAPCYASAVLAMGLCLSVCHKSEFY